MVLLRYTCFTSLYLTILNLTSLNYTSHDFTIRKIRILTLLYVFYVTILKYTYFT